MAKLPTATDQNVGRRVRIRRQVLDMTQTQLAQSIGVSFQQVQKYENGQNRIGVSRLQQICDILNVPPNYFFENESFLIGKAVIDTPQHIDVDSAAKSDLQNILSFHDGIRLVKAFLKITDPRLRTQILDFVELLLKSEAQK